MVTYENAENYSIRFKICNNSPIFDSIQNEKKCKALLPMWFIQRCDFEQMEGSAEPGLVNIFGPQRSSRIRFYVVLKIQKRDILRFLK